MSVLASYSAACINRSKCVFRPRGSIGSPSKENSMMSVFLTSSGDLARDIKKRPASSEWRALTWPKASTTRSAARIRFAATRSSIKASRLDMVLLIATIVHVGYYSRKVWRMRSRYSYEISIQRPELDCARMNRTASKSMREFLAQVGPGWPVTYIWLHHYAMARPVFRCSVWPGGPFPILDLKAINSYGLGYCKPLGDLFRRGI